MEMFKHLFKQKPSLDSDDPQIRIQAIEQSPELSTDTCTKIAREDTDLNVRKTALKRANSIPLFEEFLNHEALAKFCREEVSLLITDEHSLAKDPRILPLRLRAINDPQRIVELVSVLNGPATIAETVIALPNREVRHRVAQLLGDEHVLTAIEKVSRNRDKTLNRNIRDRLSQLKTLESQEQSLMSRAQSLIQTAKQTTVDDPHYVARRNALEKDWGQTLSEIEQLNHSFTELGKPLIDVEALRGQFPDRAELVDQSVDQSAQFPLILQKLKSGNRTEDELDQCELEWLEALTRGSPLRAVAEEFYRLTSQSRSHLNLKRKQEDTQSIVDRLSRPLRWKEPDKTTRNWKSVWQDYATAKRRIRAIDKFVESRKLQQDSQAKAWTESLLAAKTALNEIIQTCDNLCDDAKAQFEVQFSAMTKFVEEGELKKAQSAERSATTMLNRLPQRLQTSLNVKYAPAVASLRKLSEWQEFAEAPKRHSLCEAIEELVEHPLTPDVQYQRIQELRKEWNQLRPPRSRTERELQDRYDKAAKAAFQVCEHCFAERAKTRKDNLEKRIVIRDQLQNFSDTYDWKNADWKVVQQVLRTAISDWRALVPVERSKNRSVQKSFDVLTDSIRTKLHGYWDNNAARKKSLIEQVKTALDDEELTIEALLEYVMDVQKEWKTVGPAGRREEQPLWFEFNGLCNDAFELRSTKQAQRRSDINTAIEKGEELVGVLENEANDDSESARLLDQSNIKTTKKQLQELDLPKRVAKQLQDRIDEVAKTLSLKNEIVQRQRKVDELRQTLELDLKLCVMESADKPIPDSLLTESVANADWFEDRTRESVESSGIDLHELVLKMEILADVPSPEEDSTKRMEIQVSRLQRGLAKSGIGTSNHDSDGITSLIKEWCGNAFGEQPLRDRFHSAVSSYLDQTKDP